MKKGQMENGRSKLEGDLKQSVSSTIGSEIGPDVYSFPKEVPPIALEQAKESAKLYILEPIKKLNTLESLICMGAEKEPLTQPHKNINLVSPPPGFSKQDDSFSHFLPFFKFSSSISKPHICGTAESVDTQDIDLKAIPSSLNLNTLNQQHR